MTDKKRVEVAVGVIIRDEHVFLTKRAENVHQAGKWEFPGGKKEMNETIEQALSRELLEEVGIVISEPTSLLTIHHDYPDKSVSLYVYTVNSFENEPESKEGLISQWAAIAELGEVDLPEANKVIVEKLKGL